MILRITLASAISLSTVNVFATNILMECSDARQTIKYSSSASTTDGAVIQEWNLIFNKKMFSGKSDLERPIDFSLAASVGDIRLEGKYAYVNMAGIATLSLNGRTEKHPVICEIGRDD